MEEWRTLKGKAGSCYGHGLGWLMGLIWMGIWVELLFVCLENKGKTIIIIIIIIINDYLNKIKGRIDNLCGMFWKMIG